MENKTKNEYLLEMIYLIRTNLPRRRIYYVFYFIFKFIGIILSTTDLRNFESKENNITSVHSILSLLSIFNSSFKIINDEYQIYSFLIFLFSLSVIIYYTIIYLKLKIIFEDSNTFIKDETNKLLNKTQKIEIHFNIITKIIIFINFFTSLIKEYLIFGVISPFIKKNLTDNSKVQIKNINYISNYFHNEIISVKIIMIFNVFSIIFFSFIEFIFLILNNIQCIFSRFGKPLYLGNKQNIFIFILTLFQPIYGYTLIFENELRNKIRFCLCVILVIFLSVIIISNIHNYTFFLGSYIPIINFGIIIFCWYNGIIEIILYDIIQNKEKMIQSFSFLKLFISILTSLLILAIIIHKNIEYYSNLFSKHLFSNEEKITYVGEIYEFIRAFLKIRDSNYNNLDPLFELINVHKQKCTFSNCFCKSLFQTVLIKNKDYSKQLNKELNILGEQEINNRIYILYKTKKFNKTLEYYCVLHVQFIYIFSKKKLLALYFANKYLQCPLKFHFLSYYYLYEIKKQILKEIFSKKLILEDDFIGLINEEEHKKNYPIVNHLRKFHKFSIFNEIIIKLILDNFINLQIVFSIRKEMMNQSSKLNSLNKKTFRMFLSSCEFIKKNDNKIQNIIKNYLKDKTLHNHGVCYLLTNYFILIHHQIPKDISTFFDEHYHFSLISHLIENDDMEFNMKNPMIITLSNNSDTFLITYINNILCENLGYSKKKIIGSDFQDLIPFQIKNEHNLIMKQFLFLNNPYLSKKSYILDYEKYLTQCDFECRVLPDFKNSFHIIINFKLLINDEEETITYSVFLDKDFNFVSLCRDFEQLFFFNMKMFDILNINFCQFFGLNESILRKNLKKNENNIELNSYWKKENKAYLIFSNIPNEKMFKYRSTKTIKNIKKKIITYRENIDKTQILEGLSNLVKTIDEIGLDIEWYKRVKCLGERLKVELPKHSLIHHSSFKKKNYNSKSFEATFYSKFIGYIPYCIVNIKERTNVKELAESTFDISQTLNNTIKKRTSFFNPQLSITILELNHVKKNNIIQKDHPVATPINSKTSFKGFKFLENLNNINVTFSDLNISNSLNNNSKMGLLGINSFNNNKEYKEQNQVSILNKKSFKNGITPSPHNIYHPNITIQNGFQELKSKDLIKEQFIKKNNWNYKKLKYIEESKSYIDKIIILLYIIVLALGFILLILKKYKIENHRNLFACNTYIEILKTDIYLSSLLSLRLCLDISKEQFFENFYKDLILWKIQNLREHTTNFNNYINSLNENYKLNNLFKLLYQENEFQYLTYDWSISKRNTTFFEEINLFQYLLSQNYFNDDIKCNISYFINENYINFNSNNFDFISNHEKLTFYSIYNILQKYKFIFEELSFYTIDILLNFTHDFFINIFSFSLSIFIISFICFILLFRKLFINKEQISYILFHLFKFSFKVKLFETQIKNFIFVLEEFNGNTIYNFEENKDKEIENENNFKKIIKKRKSFKNKRINSINPHKQNSNNNEIENTDKNKEEEELNNLENTPKILLPKVFIISIIISIICFIFITLILAINIYYSNNTKQIYNYSIIFSMNFLQRIPKIIELVEYIEINTILRTSFQLIDNKFFFSFDKDLNYYNLKLNEETNSIINKINDPYFSNLFISGQICESNIRKFKGDSKEGLKSLKRLEYLFNEKNNLCKSSSENSFLNSKINIKSEYDYNNNATFKEIICNNFCPSTNENGLEIEIDYIYQEITSFYVDFIQFPSVENIYNLIYNNEVYRVNNDLFYVFNLVFESYANSILKESKIYNNKIKRDEEIISIFFLIIIFIIIIILIFFVFSKTEKYKDLFLFFYKMY